MVTVAVILGLGGFWVGVCWRVRVEQGHVFVWTHYLTAEARARIARTAEAMRCMGISLVEASERFNKALERLRRGLVEANAGER